MLKLFTISLALLTISNLVIAQKRSYKAVPGEYIVKLRKGVSAKQAFASPQTKSLYHKASRLKGTKGRFVKVKMRKGIKANGVKSFSSNPAFEYVEPNYQIGIPKPINGDIVRNVKISSQVLTSKLWALKSDEKFNLGIDGAWKISRGNKNVVVAVLDTGIDFTHPDLVNNMWVNAKEINGKKGVDDDNNGFVDDVVGFNFAEMTNMPLDSHGHGTHCAGTIAATKNKIGVVGVAPNVKVMAVQVLADQGYGQTGSIAEGVYYAVDNGAHVINASLGGGHSSRVMREALKYASDRGVLFVAAAGNDNNNNDKKPSYPANYKIDNVLSVGAYAQDGKRAYSMGTSRINLEPEAKFFSNYGSSSVDVFAPGAKIASTIPAVVNPKTKIVMEPHGYGFKSGTSMAAPHVAGVAALMISVNPKLSKNPKLIKNILIKTSTPTASLKPFSLSKGRVNAAKAVQVARSSMR